MGSAGDSGGAAWACYFAGVIGPAAAAFGCAALGSRVTVAELLRRLTRWRVPFRWYVVAILLPFVLRGAATVLVTLSAPETWRIAFRPAEAVVRITLLMLVLVPFEEVGWRGHLLPLLQRRHGFLGSSVIVAGIWSLWHLPLAWASVGYQRSDAPWRYMAYFTVTIIPVSCLLTWLFHQTGGSVPLASAFHLAVNLADFILVMPAQRGERVLLTTAVISMLLIGIVWWRDTAKAR
jgi:membrane protease YdiL (CAAX protease family)